MKVIIHHFGRADAEIIKDLSAKAEPDSNVVSRKPGAFTGLLMATNVNPKQKDKTKNVHPKQLRAVSRRKVRGPLQKGSSRQTKRD